MRLSKPRIAPLKPSEMSEEVQEMVRPAGGAIGLDGVPNVIATLAQHPKLLKRWNVFSNHVLFKSTLPPREREILILRIGWLCQAEYEWGQHVRIGKAAGLDETTIACIKEGPNAPGLDPFESLLLRAVDELHEDAFLSDATWAALSKRYDRHQLMDLVFTVGQYNLVSMALNTFGVQLDEGVDGF